MKSVIARQTVRDIEFTDIEKEYSLFWKIRKGLFPAVGAVRETGTTVIIEDIAFASYRFAIEYEKENNNIKNGIKLFVDKYRTYNQIDEYQLENIDFYFKLQILRRLSYILKKYLQGVESWTQDLEKNFKFLCLAKRIGNPLKDKL